VKLPSAVGYLQHVTVRGKFVKGVVGALHFQHRYDQPYLACQVWAVVVDATAVSTVIRIISGLYLWARWPPRHR